MSTRSVIGSVIVALGVVWTVVKANEAPASRSIPLLGTVVQWRYPGAEILLDGSTRSSDAKTPGVQSGRFQSILTTPDPVEKVARFYTEKLALLPVPVPQDPKAEAKSSDAKSVFDQDDSKDRPVQLRVLVVNQADTSTTLVISRADGESKTHIACSQYLRFDGQR